MHARTFLTLAVASALVLGAAAAPASAAPPTVDRVLGDDASAIAVAASKAQFASTADVVVIANGDSLHGGLAGATTASALGGPLLLVEKSRIAAAVKAEIVRLAPSRIVVVGGTSSVSTSVYAALADIQSDISRIATDRYLNAEALARLAFPGGASTAVIATGEESSTLVPAASYAASIDAPILFVRKTDTAPRASLAGTLAALGVDHAVVIGPTTSITAKFQTALATAGLTTQRVTGADRYTTALAIAALYPAPTRAFVVSGTRFLSGLPAIGLAASTGSPLVLSIPYCAPAPLTDWVTDAAIPALTLVGSPRFVRGLVGDLQECRSTTSASSIWVMANKKNKLSPVGYVPSGLRVPNIQRSGSHQVRSAVASALEDMAADARADGAGRIGIVSGYRSYSTQKALYARYVATNGQKWADSQSARAGFSEHQTGLSADLAACSASACSSIYSIASTAQGKWLAKNSWKYGFVMRYENGRTSTTGYAYEPWHFRYIGPVAAADYHEGGFSTLEGYFGYPAAPGY